MKIIAIFGFAFFALGACSSVPKQDSEGQAYSHLNVSNPKKILFIHGMFMSNKSWQGWAERFRKAGYEVSTEAWPMHEAGVEVQRTAENQKKVAQLQLSQVLDHYRQILNQQKVKPIIVGHSMGGLIAQILLSEGLAQAAIAIDSAPPKGLYVLNWSFLRANWDSIRPFPNLDEAIDLDFSAFSYAFTNAQPLEEQKRAFQEFYVPDSKRVGKGPTTDVAAIDENKSRGPLLIVAGGDDHIIPPNLNYENFEKYKATPAYTEFILFPGRDHWTAGAPGWETVAVQVQKWIEARF